MLKFTSCLFLGIAIASAALARPATPDEDSAISQVINKFVMGMNGRDAQAVADATIIPRVLNAQAVQLGVEQDALYVNFLNNLNEFLATIDIHDVGFNRDGLNISESEKIKWTWMDYHFKIDVEGDALAVQNRTLAIEDNTQWYLVRVDEQNLPVLMSLFPEIGFENYSEAVITRANPN